MNYIKGLFLSILLISVPAFAEVETTSSIRGTVNVAGATVEITNQSTGQTKSVTAGTTGNFSASFLKVGGPYSVSASAPGYAKESVDGLFLVLNESTNISIRLVSTADVEEVVTTASRAGSIKVGTGTLLDRTAMDGVPTINRSVADFAKLDPRVSINTGSSRNAEISVMGANNRYNDFSIDGVSFNDPFGLNANGFGSMRNPISLDFVDQNLNTPTGSSINSKLKVNVRSSTWQKYFKNQLFKYWGIKCVLTNVQNKDLLIGAHIKPWTKSDDKEKIDVFNGLPLSPNADKIFELGLISFNEQGKLIKSSQLSNDDLSKLNINLDVTLDFKDEHFKYLNYHRLNKFKK